MLFCAFLCSSAVIVGARFPLALIFMAIVLSGLLVLSGLKRNKYIIVIVMALITVATLIHNLSDIQKYAALDEQEDDCVFTVKEITYKSPEFYCADVKIEKSQLLKKGDNLTLYYFDGGLEIGDVARGNLNFRSIEGEYKEDYYSRNIFLEAIAREYEIIDSDFVLKAVDGVRKYIKKTVLEHLDFSEAATLCALLFGDSGLFTADFSYNVSVAGVKHVMVVSGMHLTILVGLTTAITKKLFYNRYISAVLMLLSTLLLSTVCGFTMSILRAGVMYIIMALGLIFKRKSVPENSLGTAVSIILAVSPFAIFNVGFQLSVVSTFGILALALPIDRFVKQKGIIKNNILRGVFSALLISVCATLLTLPIVINIFGFVSSVGVLTTVIIAYPVTLSIWISVIGLLINLFSHNIAALIFIPCEYLLKFTNFVINRMGSLPFAVIETDKILVYITLGIIIVIFCVLLACKRRADMIKLEEMRNKIIKEGGGNLKWR